MDPFCGVLEEKIRVVQYCSKLCCVQFPLWLCICLNRIGISSGDTGHMIYLIIFWLARYRFGFYVRVVLFSSISIFKDKFLSTELQKLVGDRLLDACLEVS